MSKSLPGWSTNLHRLFLVPQPHYDDSDPQRSNLPTIRHPAGTLWRVALVQSIFSDLINNMDGCRRLLRLEFPPGLNGILVYELPQTKSERVGTGKNTKLRLGEVFGRIEGQAQDGLDDDAGGDGGIGMDVDVLLNRVGARIIFVPGHACTSFVVSQILLFYSCSFHGLRLMYPSSSPFFLINGEQTGQVMNAAIRDSANMHPMPASKGIIISSSESCVLISPEPKPVMDILAYLRSSNKNKIPFVVGIGFDDLLSPLPRRSRERRRGISAEEGHCISIAQQESPPIVNNVDSDLDDGFGLSVLSIDSIGPYTPSPTRIPSGHSKSSLVFGDDNSFNYEQDSIDMPVSRPSFAILSDSLNFFQKGKGPVVRSEKSKPSKFVRKSFKADKENVF
jgi:hypothetical protein